MTTLHKAAQQALEALEHATPTTDWSYMITALRAALAQQDEPLNLRDPAVQKRLATQWGYVPAAQAEPAQEPVAEVFVRRDGVSFAFWLKAPPPERTKLYTAPPQCKPLTEEEIMHIGMTHQSLRQVVRAVERAHGIKEN